MFAKILIILTASLIAIALFRRLRLPPILGYLCVGLVCGPSAFGWVGNDDEGLSLLAEMGVVFLLFTLGLEFSLPRMQALRHTVFGLGSLQVGLCGFALGGLFYYVAGLSLQLSVILGAGLALSSTAIVSKELTSLNEIFNPHGQNAIGVLLFQDLVAVLLLTLVPILASDQGTLWYVAVATTLGKTAVLFAGLLIASRWLLPRLFHEVAAARSPELFVLLALVIVMLTAWLTHLLGLSMALGAFLAGMLLGESHYRHQIEADLRPFRDILLGLFFVTVGMLIDLHLLASDGLLIAALTLLLLCLKGGLITLIVRLRGDSVETSWRTGLALAQGGEFFFALLTQLQGFNLVSDELGSLLLAATFCSMLLTPLLLRAAPELAQKLRHEPPPSSQIEEIALAGAELSEHVLICGYGRVGQSVGRFLRLESIPFLALDDDPVRVQEANAGAEQVHYGDSRRADLLQALNIAQARLLVVAVDNADSALRIVANGRRLNAEIPILVRLRDDSRLADLLAAGATEVVPEVLESSLMLASHALILLDLPQAQVQEHMDAVRHSRYRLLRGFYHGAQANLLTPQGKPRTLLHAVSLSQDARACGKTLADVALYRLGVEVQGLRRAGIELNVEDSVLQPGDAVLLAGTLEAVEAGEALLLAGA